MSFGDRCTRCGDCCTKYPCGIAHAVFYDGPEHERLMTCPALEREADGCTCGLVRQPSKYVDLGTNVEWKDEWFGRMVAGMLGIGMGCCSTPDSVREHAQMWALRGEMRHAS